MSPLVLPPGFPDWLCSHYEKGQFYEQAMLDHIQHEARPGEYVDIGASSGNHSALFALLCPSTTVHSFEPNLSLKKHFLELMTANGIADKVHLYSIALSDAPGEVEATFVIRKGTPNWTARVPAKRLDDVLPNNPVAVIKIDVEGAEPLVLSGALGTIARCRPLIFAEAQDVASQAATAAVLDQVGYAATGRVFNHTPTYEYAPA